MHGDCSCPNGLERTLARQPRSCALLLQDFERCLGQLRSSTRTAWAAPVGAPLYGMGHSNGALMHLLLGAIAAVPYASVAAVSFNNKCVPACHMAGCRQRQSPAAGSSQRALMHLPSLAAPQAAS